MTIKKTTKWVFPVGNKTLSQNAYYRKLSLADSGFFPIGQNKLWHGGIHIDEKVMSELQVDHVHHFPEVKCMADGEIVAYRLNETYPSIEYDDETALYSSSFVLVRHLLQMDYVTPSMSIDNEFEVIAGDDMMGKGVNIRVYPQEDKIGMLPNGAEITVALDKEQLVGAYYWYPLMSINNGYSSVPKLETIAAKISSNGSETLNCLGWISLGKTKLTTATQTVTGQTDKPETNEALQKGLAIRATKQSNGNALSLLPIGSKLKLSEFDEEQKWGKVTTLSAGSYSSTPNIVGWVEMAKLKALLTDESEGDKKPHQLYLYSLYMHLADMAHYQHYEAAKIPPYFEKNTYKVTSKELDEVKGLNLRSKPESGAANAGNILAVLQTGTKVKLHLGFHESGKNSWYAVASLCEGYHAIPSLNTIDYTLADGQTSKAILGWIFTKDTINESGEYTIRVSEDKHDKSKGLRVRTEGKASGTIVSMLPEGTQIHITSAIPAQGYVKISHNDIESGKATLPLAEGDYYIWSGSLSLIAGKQRYDEVVVLDEPLLVKAEEVIGHVGHYQHYEQKVKKDSLPTSLYSQENGLKSFSFKHCLHVELFSCDDFTTFINNTRQESKKILNKDKPLLLVEKGAKLYRIKNGSEDATIASNVDVQVVGHYAERWQQVKECYRLSFNAVDFGYELNNIGETLAITASNKTKFVTLLGTQTSETITEADIPNQVAFTGTYINPTTGGQTTDKATAIAANSGYSDILVTLVRQGKTIWVDVSELDNGKRKSLSGTLTGWKAHPLSLAESDDNLVVGYPQIIKIHGLNNVEVFGIAERATDASGKAWRYITAGSDKHLEIKGWVKTTQEKVKRVSPWEWPGFVQIEESKTLTDLSRLNLATEAQLAEPQVNQLQQAEPVDYENCQLLKHLSTIIKHINHDEAEVPLNDKHLKAALGYPWIAQQLGHTVVKYESEWYSEKDDAGNMPKWQALDVPVIGEAKSYLDFLNEDCDKNTALSNIELSYCEKMPGADAKKLLQETNHFLDTLSQLNEQSTVDATKATKVEKFKDELAKQIAIWTAEKQRIAKLLWWGELAEKLAKKQADQVAQTASTEGATAEGEKSADTASESPPALPSLSANGQGWFLHPAALFTFDTKIPSRLGKVFERQRYQGTRITQYGPVYTGSISLANYSGWDELINQNIITQDHKRILIAMSANEGNLDAVQAYDSEAVSAGAMQKTIRTTGQGQLSTQMYDFKVLHPELFKLLFEDYGWYVKKRAGEIKAYYVDAITNTEYHGAELKAFLRNESVDFGEDNQSKSESFPLEALVIAIRHEKYQQLQVTDFIKAIDEALDQKPIGKDSTYTFTIREVTKSVLGQATVFDHHVNRPGHVAEAFGWALDKFFTDNPTVSKTVTTWGTNHASYENIILEHYVKIRWGKLPALDKFETNGMSDSAKRHANLVNKLG